MPKSDATVDYELEDDNVHPSVDLYEIYERSQKLVLKTKNRTLRVVLSRILETELKYIRDTKHNLDTYISAISSSDVKGAKKKVSDKATPSTSGKADNAPQEQKEYRPKQGKSSKPHTQSHAEEQAGPSTGKDQ